KISSGHDHLYARFRTQHQGDIQRIGNHGQVLQTFYFTSNLGGGGARMENARIGVLKPGDTLYDKLLSVLYTLVSKWKRKLSNLIFYVTEIGTSMISRNKTFLFQFLQILTNGCFSDLKKIR